MFSVVNLSKMPNNCNKIGFTLHTEAVLLLLLLFTCCVLQMTRCAIFTYLHIVCDYWRTKMHHLITLGMIRFRIYIYIYICKDVVTYQKTVNSSIHNWWPFCSFGERSVCLNMQTGKRCRNDCSTLSEDTYTRMDEKHWSLENRAY